MMKCATSVPAVGLALLWMMSCGGRSENDGSGTAGSQNSAGSTSAGAAGVGASAGGPVGDVCGLPKVSGPCDAYAPSFWHNPTTGLCEPFIYGGCQGNGNRFATRNDCINRCGGGGANWGGCSFDSDCVVASPGCCEACEPVQDHDLLAINGHRVGDYQNSSCPGGAACAPCPGATEYDATRKYFKPVCVAHECSLLDVRQSPLTTCVSDADCTLRDGVYCCAQCDGSGYVPVNKSADFCDGQPMPCPGGCPATTADQYHAVCKGSVCAFQLPLR